MWPHTGIFRLTLQKCFHHQICILHKAYPTAETPQSGPTLETSLAHLPHHVLMQRRWKLGERSVKTYAGPGQGVKSIKASEWEPFVRTMPHSEYPSASACICQVILCIYGCIYPHEFEYWSSNREDYENA